MKIIPLLFPALVATFLNAYGSEDMLTTIYQPLDPMSGGAVVVREVPFVTSGAFPEVLFTSITQPHIPQQRSPSKVGDINGASRAGISLSCESATAGQKKLYIIWDFTKADRELVNGDLIKALLGCLEQTARKSMVLPTGKPIVLYSKFVAAENFPEFKKMIEAKFPPQAARQLEEDSNTSSGN